MSRNVAVPQPSWRALVIATVVLGTALLHARAATAFDARSGVAPGRAAGPVSAVAKTTFTSVGFDDGYVVESSETSGRGMAIYPVSTTLRVGDDFLDRQYRSILSFFTSLPGSATIQKAILRLRYQGKAGTNPFGTHGALYVDMKLGAFSGGYWLEGKDFSAAASKFAAARVPATPVSGWYSVPLSSSLFPLISRSGYTQFRLRFAKDDNDDRSSDYVSIYSGNAPAGYRPVLEITYSTP